MTADPFATPIPRDRWGRPLVVPPGGGKAVGYTRMTTFVGATEDTFNLERWKMRMVALGLTERDDLRLAVFAHRDDKAHLNKLCDQAVEAAKASAAATVGTAHHALADQFDRGELDLAKVPAEYRKDLEAYARATEHLEVVEIERFGVLDQYKVGGTWDRIYRLPDGRLVIGDTKTGSIEFGMGKIAGQLAGYSRATPYDHETGQRGTPNPDRGIDQDVALVVHLPAGKGECELVEVDIAAGWPGLQLCQSVRDWRDLAKGKLHRPWPGIEAPTLPLGAVSRETPTPQADPQPVDLLDLIANAGTVDDLTGLWTAHTALWTAEHTEMAKARKALLVGGLA